MSDDAAKAHLFASRYRIDRLLHAEPFADVRDAIAREKQIKAWRRSHKVNLIAQSNPDWRDLGEEWFGPQRESAAKGKNPTR
jgi:predicted GIY-YIG superfamily endonuclease